MFRSPMVFIVGAGASAEFGLPTGINIKSKIAEKLNIKFDFISHYPNSGDWVIVEALRHYVNQSEDKRGGIGAYQQEAWKIHDAMPQAGSIDTFLDVHRGNNKMELCGKLAITGSILEAERESKIFYDPLHQKKLDFSALENTWFNNFWRILTEGISRSEIDSLFDNVTFISFNYDRCIEHLLIDAIRNYYDVNHENAIVLVRKIKIFHPYGTVGALSGIGGASQRLVAFGEDIQNGPILLEVSKQIKTFTERIHDETELKHMRDSVSNAKVAVFLGFAFHEQNMDLLSYGVPTNIKQVFATSCGVSSRDRNVVVAQIVKALGQQLYSSSIELGNELENNLTCFELFKQYWRSLKQS